MTLSSDGLFSERVDNEKENDSKVIPISAICKTATYFLARATFFEKYQKMV